MNNSLLSVLILTCFSSFASNKTTEIQSLLKKTISSTSNFIIATILIPHNIFEHISTCVHEHGHGLARGESYTIKIKKQNDIFQPWQAEAIDCGNTFFESLAGPLAGLSITYIQIIGLNMAKGYLEKQPLSLSFNKGLKYPITFFPAAINTGIKYGSLLINPQSINLLNLNAFISLYLDIFLFSRMGRIIGESIYGLLPYHIRYHGNPGDGEKIWKKLFGENVPTFKGNLVYITFALLFLPYIIGIALAFAQY